MIEDDIRILKTIHELGKARPKDIAERFGEPYTPSDLSAYLDWLEKKNLLEKVTHDPSTYKVSGLGLIAIGILPKEAWTVFKLVPSDKRFRFQTGTGPDKFTGVSASNLSDLIEKVKTVDVKALEFHVPRGDVEKWVKDVLGDDELAEKIGRIRERNLRGDALRNQLSNTINNRIKELTSITA